MSDAKSIFDDLRRRIAEGAKTAAPSTSTLESRVAAIAAQGWTGDSAPSGQSPEVAGTPAGDASFDVNTSQTADAPLTLSPVADESTRNPSQESAEAGATPVAVLPQQRDEKRRVGTLMADVRRIADSWFGNGRASDKITRGAGDVPTPEELEAGADERGVDVRYRTTTLNKLKDQDFPVVALVKDGTTEILTGRAADKSFVVSTPEGTSKEKASTLSERLSGVFFFVKPKPEAARQTAEPAEPDAGEERREAGPSARGGAFGYIFRETVQNYRGLLGQLALTAFLSNLFTMALPLFSMAVYDRVIPHLAWETLWALSIGVVIILTTDLAMRYIRLKLTDAVGLSISSSLQSKLYSRIVHARMITAPTVSGGIGNAFRDVEGLCHAVPSMIISIVVDVPFFLATAGLIYSLAGSVVIAPFIGAFALVGLHMWQHHGQDVAKRYARYVGTQSNILMETVGSLETVKLTGSERFMLRRWERMIDASSMASHENRLQGTFLGQASVVISQFVTVLALAIGVYEISTGTMTIGALSASTLLIGRMMTPVSQLMGLVHRLHQLSSSTTLIEKLLHNRTETAGDTSGLREETPVVGHIVMKNVSFSYPGEQAPCLDSINLEIRPGERIGLIGRIGSGKSSLLRLILRLHDATEGTILLDGHDVRQSSPRAVRRHFGFMRQDSVLFDDTLQANIAFGLDVLKLPDFERAVTMSGVKEFAARHQAGFGMRVGPRGERLSGGERQSVALARVLAENTPALILDEPTASMDNALEARIVRDLKEYMVGKTLIVATHRAPLLSLVDRIIWMEGGKIMADGPKEMVLRQLSQAA